tara:strand:- start:664 stop:1512 length:849 start_codon:yes stop_codon:yes gene_type:complete
MKKLFLFAFMIHSVSIFAQEADASGGIATVQFSATGINDMENQAFFNYFLEELGNASEDTFQDQAAIGEKVNSLALGSSDCYTAECMKAALDALAADQLIAGSLSFTKNKYRVKLQVLDPSKAEKPKKFSIRYKGEVDGFVTELQILAWDIMGKTPPGTLLGKRKPSQESLFENPMFKTGLILGVAGLSASSYISNTAAASKSQDAADQNEKDNWEPGRIAHQESADKSSSEATLSLLICLASLGYAYYDGVFDELFGLSNTQNETLVLEESTLNSATVEND